MSGVIDDNGVQWEHCNCCGAWVKIDNLGYIKPSAEHKYGIDICAKCVDKKLRAREIKFSSVVPAKLWKRVTVKA